MKLLSKNKIVITVLTNDKRRFSDDVENETKITFNVGSVKFNSMDQIVRNTTIYDKDLRKIKEEFITINFVNGLSEDLVYELQLSDFRCFCLSKWKEDHPSSKVSSYSEIMNLIRVNNSFASWYSDAKKEFSRISTAPEWIKGSYEDVANWSEDFVNASIEYKQNLKNLEEQKRIANAKYIATLKEINHRKETHIMEMIDTSYVVLIDKISRNSLPFELVDKYASLSPKELDLKLDEELSAYKLKLLHDYTSKKISREELIFILKEALSSG